MARDGSGTEGEDGITVTLIYSDCDKKGKLDASLASMHSEAG